MTDVLRDEIRAEAAWARRVMVMVRIVTGVIGATDFYIAARFYIDETARAAATFDTIVGWADPLVWVAVLALSGLLSVGGSLLRSRAVGRVGLVAGGAWFGVWVVGLLRGDAPPYVAGVYTLVVLLHVLVAALIATAPRRRE